VKCAGNKSHDDPGLKKQALAKLRHKVIMPSELVLLLGPYFEAALREPT
jgi:hypothetical protein